jgi:N-acetylneuraminate synthase/N,N'-diacetyllegionaminate synthase
MSAAITIAERTIGSGAPCFVIAEAGVNHDGDRAVAERLVDAAAQAGADAVKFQTFAAERLVTVDAPKAEYQKAGAGAGESQYEMLRRLELSAEAHRGLLARAAERRILFLSTPFDEESADFLADLGVAAFKLPSGEVTNLPFLAHVARKGRPIILSTGMSTLEEVAAAVDAIKASGDPPLALLHCVSNYPADPAEANLRAMASLAERFRVPVGFSDHTLGIEVSLGAAALGASILEKHLTLDRTRSGPDHRASLEPAELSALVEGVRKIERALGDGRKRPMPSEAAIAAVARKSLVAARDIPAETTLTSELVVSRRPGTGLSPAVRDEVVGRTLRVSVKKGTPLTLEMLR